MMDAKLQELIKKSGNNLHAEVAQLLENLGWEVDISSYYHDDTTDKPREVDIVASKQIIVSSPGIGEGGFRVFLFIECKYFKEGVAFRMYNNNPRDSSSAIIFHGMSEDILNESNTNLKKTHHYIRVPLIAKLYDGKENNEIFNSITGAVKSLVFFRERRNEKGLYYPMVVYSGVGGLYPIENNNLTNLESVEPLKNLVFGLNYSYRSAVNSRLNTQYFCVDFVNKGELGDFLEMIEKQEIGELNGFARFLLLKGRRL
ncbi:MAG: hypothetical protein AAB875_06690 [Patescibacteria group bacterium]